MGLFEDLRDILMELLDLDAGQIRQESYLVRDLGVESIDFLELAVALNERFGVEVQDDVVFLRQLRLHLAKAGEIDAAPLEYLAGEYAFLSVERIREILTDLDGGPVIQVRDVERYVQWRMTNSKAA